LIALFIHSNLSPGGIAGGTKFIVAGILFKLATDEYGLYDGFEGAIKVAGHDLK
jgi:hypothetical protein